MLFVFSVTNPWTQSAWQLLDFVQKKWLKNIVFVLQQADLRSEAEIDIIRRHLEDTALQRLGFQPPIFAVSARKALAAKTSTTDKERLLDESHFRPLENQISRMVTEGSARMLKLQSTGRTAGLMLNEIAEEVQASFATIQRDEQHLGRITISITLARFCRFPSPRKYSGKLWAETPCACLTLRRSFDD